MYGLDARQDLGFLDNCVLLQVGIGENEIVFRFSGDVVLVVESDFQIDDGIESVSYSNPIEAAGMAAKLVGGTVISAQATPSGNLRINLVGHRSIEVVDSSENFESYQLEWPGGSLVV